MSTPGHQALEAARTESGMSFDELWMAYFALGGAGSPAVVRTYLGGTEAPAIDHDMLAQAINEWFIERGGNHPVPYSDELVPPPPA